MADAMPEHDKLYNHPQKEIAFIYEGKQDDRQKYNGKYIVEVPKKRPDWFPKNLMTKAR